MPVNPLISYVGRRFRCDTTPVWEDGVELCQSGGRTGVLLLHAVYGSPWEMHAIAHYLAALGCTVHVPRLRGHASVPDALFGIRAWDWVEDARRAFSTLAARTDRQFVIGQCLGGRVGLALCLRHDLHVAGLVTIGTAFKPLPDQRFLPRPLAWLPFGWQPTSIPGPGGLDFAGVTRQPIRVHALTPWRCYQAYRPSSVPALGRPLRRFVSDNLPRFEDPVMFVHASDDHLYDQGHARFAYERVGSRDKSVYIVDSVTHILATNERKLPVLLRRLGAFIRART